MTPAQQGPVEILGPGFSESEFLDRFLASFSACESIKGAAGYFTGWGNNAALMAELERCLAHANSFLVADPTGPTHDFLPKLLALSERLAKQGFMDKVWLYVAEKAPPMDGFRRSLLHAKTWQFRFPDGTYEIWIGSGNGTESALGEHVECWAILRLGKNDPVRKAYRDKMDGLVGTSRGNEPKQCLPVTAALIKKLQAEALIRMFHLRFDAHCREALTRGDTQPVVGRRFVIDVQDPITPKEFPFASFGVGSFGDSFKPLLLRVRARSDEDARATRAMHAFENDVLFGRADAERRVMYLAPKTLNQTRFGVPVELEVVGEFDGWPFFTHPAGHTEVQVKARGKEIRIRLPAGVSDPPDSNERPAEATWGYVSRRQFNATIRASSRE